MKYLFIILILLEIVWAKEIKVSVESYFLPFLHSLEKQGGIKFNIQEKNTSLEAFEDIQNGRAQFAIVRGDILSDNMESKNFFEHSAFQNFKLISKLNENFSSYLYLFSLKHEPSAYTLLNMQEASHKKIKKIGIGYLKDLSIIYLDSIAKEIGSQYSFHYRSYSHTESLKKLVNRELDACYLFTSQNFASQSENIGLFVSSIRKPKQVSDKNFARLFQDSTVFTKSNGGIRVDNYLISSTKLLESDLKSLLISLKKKENLSTDINPKFGNLNTNVTKLSTKIDSEEKEKKEKASQRKEKCEDTLTKAKELISQQSFLEVYKKDAIMKIKKVLISIKKSEDLKYFQPRVNPLLLTVNESAREASVIIKNIQNAQKDCDATQVSININNLKLKIEAIKRTRRELAIIESEILLKGQTDEKELFVKQEQEEKILEQAQRNLQFELEKEARARIEATIAETKIKVEEESKGFFKKLGELIIP